MARALVTLHAQVQVEIETDEGHESFSEAEFRRTIIDNPSYFESDLAGSATIVDLDDLELDQEDEDEEKEEESDDKS